MALELGLVIALSGLALWLLAHGLDYIGIFEKYKIVKKVFGLCLILDFIMIMIALIVIG